MSYRLIALDLDDTLLDENSSISHRNKKALQKAMQKGIRITLATGRMFRSTARYARELGIDLPLITYHGALICGLEDKEPCYYRPVEHEVSLEVVEECQKKGYHVNLYLEDSLYIKEHNEYSRYYGTISSVDMVPVGDLREYLQQEKKSPTKITLIDWEDRLDEWAVHLQEKYRGRLKVMGSLPYFLEITHPGATKGQALELLSQQLHIPRKEIVAFGDSYNDVDMVEYAGLGVAVGNARPPVKEAADLVTSSHSEDGVAEVIENHVLES